MCIKSYKPYSKDICPYCKGKGKLYRESNLGFKIEKACKHCSGKISKKDN